MRHVIEAELSIIRAIVDDVEEPLVRTIWDALSDDDKFSMLYAIAGQIFGIVNGAAQAQGKPVDDLWSQFETIARRNAPA